MSWPLPWGCCSSAWPLPPVKYLFLTSNLNFSCYSFMPFLWVLSLVTREKRWVPTPSLLSMRKLWATMRSPFNILFSRLNKPGDFSCSSYAFFSRPFIIFVVLLWTFLCPFGTVASKTAHMMCHRISFWPVWINCPSYVFSQGLPPTSSYSLRVVFV